MTKQKTVSEKMKLTSLDIAEGKREQLKQVLQQLLPGTINESGIDFEQLKRALGAWVEPGKERFGLQWPGKAECMKILQQPSVATLKPAREESINFDKTENLFIEGDNLEVLKLLQKSYFGKVKMIYIDPPYNTGNEFIYPDKYEETLETYLQYTGQVDAEGKKFSTNSDSEGRYHSRWLNMIYPRLYLARNLLKENGIIYISIGQDELSNLLQLCYEIFGEENLVTICSRVMKTGGQKGLHFSPCVDYIIAMAKNIQSLEPFREEISQNLIDKVYTKTQVSDPRKGEKYRLMGLYQAMLDKRANQRYYIECPDGQLVIPPGETFPDQPKEGAQTPPKDGDGVWRWKYSTFAEEKLKGNVEFIRSDKTSLITPEGNNASWNVYYKIWLNDRLESGQLPGNILDKFESRHSSAELKAIDIPFDFAKPSSLMKFLMAVSGVKDGEITLDFFAGSGSTGHAAMELSKETQGKKPFICIQLPELTKEDSQEYKSGFKTISDIAKERLRRVGKNLKENSIENGFDIGFRVFKLTRSNFKVWEGNVEQIENLEKQLSLHVDHIAKASSSEEILYELLLKAGFPLTTKVEKLKMASKEVLSIEEGALLICLDKELTQSLIDALAESNPLQVICLDEGFKGNDQLKANAVQTFKARAQEEESEIVFRTV